MANQTPEFITIKENTYKVADLSEQAQHDGRAFAEGTCGVHHPAAQGAHRQPKGGTAGDRCHESSRAEGLFHP